MPARAQRFPRALVADAGIDPVPGGCCHYELETARGRPGLEVGADELDLRIGGELLPGDAHQVVAEFDPHDVEASLGQWLGRDARRAADLKHLVSGPKPDMAD